MLSKLSAKCKMDSERDALKRLKEKLGPIWYDLHFDDAISSALYILGYETAQKQKIDNLKRNRRNLKVELMRIGKETAARGKEELDAHYVLAHAKSLSPKTKRSIFLRGKQTLVNRGMFITHYISFRYP